MMNNKCPWDTDGDGNCGRPRCPYCEKDRPFGKIPDQWLLDIGAALDSAAGEGAFGNSQVVEALGAEFKSRDLQPEGAYSRGKMSPDQWVKMMGWI